ncbi:FlgD immunoglobulin-like domain containing protein [Streptomyces sp. NPDC046371]|uniref:FlgD immunoglobulin-like domain containing protein n=1 Tax=unclassified Streptomyces TaxID=2593676 RepID=UPI0033DDD787
MNAHPRVRARRALGAATTLAIAVGLTATTPAPALAAAAPATAADEIVIPNPGRYQPRMDTLFQAGATGYAHRQEGSDAILWTDAASGATKTLSWQAEGGHSGLSASNADGGTAVTITDLATDRTTRIPLPQGRSWVEAFTTDTVLAGTYEAEKLTSIALVSAENGAPVERPVTGLPDGLEDLHADRQDSRGALFTNPIRDRAFYLDFASATLVELPAPLAGSTHYRLSQDHILAWKGGSGTLLTVPRSNPAAQPVTTVVVPSTAGSVKTDFAVLGDWVFATPYTGQLPSLGPALRAVPLGGGAAVELLPNTGGRIIPAPDGSLLTAGGTNAADRAVRRIDIGPDGKPRLATVRTVPVVPRGISHLALGGGRVSFLSPHNDYLQLFDVDTNGTAAPVPSPPNLRFSFAVNPVTGLASLGDGDSVASWGTSLAAPTSPSSYRFVPLPAQSTVVDAAGRYAVATSGTKTYVGDLDNFHADEPSVLLTLTNSPATVWGTKAWKPATTAGTVNSYDLKTKVTSAPVDLRSGCRPTELQTTGRWLYWACGTTKAGVYDQTLKKSVAVPTGEALLGDGFVVRHEGDKLRLTDAATGVTTDFADLPASASDSGRGTTWTVDKFGDDVAFIVPGTQDIHVKRVAVTPQPFTLLDTGALQVSGGTSKLRWRMSRAVGAWSVEIKNAAGKVVRTYRGTTGNGAGVRIDWDSRDDLGRGVEDGTYTYVMNAQPVNGVGAALRRTGTVEAFDVGLTTLPGTYTPVTPTRLMDTRSGLGVPKAKVGAGKTVSLKVTGAGGVPATGVTAVVLNVTATNATTSSHVSVYPSGTRQTSASNLNFTAGRTAANLVTVPVVDGHVKFFNRAGSVDLLADIAGYYTAGTAGSAYQPVTPKRLMDTRNGTGVAKAKVAANGTVTLPVTEPGATAVVLNVTATNPTATSFVSVYPYGTARTAASNLNFTAGRTVPNLVVVPVKDGKVTFYNKYGTVDLLADVAGYFKKDTGSVFTGMQPYRLMDTRDGTGVARGKVGAGKTVSLHVGERCTAVVLNVTATNPTSAGYVSVHPYGTTRTAASNLNFTAGQTIPNLVVVPVRDGQVTFYNHAGTVDLIADIAGYYTD